VESCVAYARPSSPIAKAYTPAAFLDNVLTSDTLVTLRKHRQPKVTWFGWSPWSTLELSIKRGKNSEDEDMDSD
jgi:hypothetical protein